MGVGGQRHAPAVLPPGKKPSTHCTGGWVGPRASLVGCEKLGHHRVRSRTVHPVASRYIE